MHVNEIGPIADWAVDKAEEYRVPVSTVTELYKAMRKSHNMEETKNIIEKGFIGAESRKGIGDRNECRSTKV